MVFVRFLSLTIRMFNVNYCLINLTLFLSYIYICIIMYVLALSTVIYRIKLSKNIEGNSRNGLFSPEIGMIQQECM